MVGPKTDPRACLGNVYITDALSAANIDKLPKYSMLFLGPVNAASPGLHYDYTAAQKLAVKNWLTAGGRLFAAAEWMPFFGVPNQTRFNDFMTYLGAPGIQLQIDFACNSGCDTWSGVPQPVAIMDGLVGIWHAATGKLTATDATVLCKTNIEVTPPCNVSEPFAVAKQIGKGMLVACADSNTTAGCSVPNRNCTFFQRLCNMAVSAMLTPT